MKNENPGVNVLLLGATGTGKTYSLHSLPAVGVTPFILATEPGVHNVLGDLPDEQCHWHYVSPNTVGWEALIDSAIKINKLSLESLSKLSGINRQKFTEYVEMLTTFHEFTCDRCGENFGDVSEWGTDRALVVDSLSGLSVAAMNLVVGSKPVQSKPDWGIAMSNLKLLIDKLCLDTKCHFILTSHLEREFDEITGGIKLMASTLGQKLAPKIPRFFDDIIQSRREGSTFLWSTAAPNVDLKTRNLPIEDNLKPNFGPLIDHWTSTTE